MKLKQYCMSTLIKYTKNKFKKHYWAGILSEMNKSK